MMMKILLLALVGVACAASVENRQGQVAQARDTSSSYAAPAAPAAQSYDDGGSQGNLYYYYYPVSEEAPYEDTGVDIFAAIILPLLILGGLLLLLSSLTFTLGTGRRLKEESTPTTLFDELHTEIERVFNLYLNAFENEECIQRTICDMGHYAREVKGKDFVISLIEPLVPEGMQTNMAIFKKAAQAGFETGKCKKYKCIPPKLLSNN